MTKGNHLFYLNGLPCDGADRVLLLAKQEAKDYNKPITVRCTFTDDELVIQREVEYVTVYPDGTQTLGELFK